MKKLNGFTNYNFKQFSTKSYDRYELTTKLQAPGSKQAYTKCSGIYHVCERSTLLLTLDSSVI